MIQSERKDHSGSPGSGWQRRPPRAPSLIYYSASLRALSPPSRGGEHSPVAGCTPGVFVIKSKCRCVIRAVETACLIRTGKASFTSRWTQPGK